MRYPNRLDAFYNELAKIHKESFPDWRFGQFMMNFLSWYGRDPFYIEEDKLIEKLNIYVAFLKNKELN